MTKKMKCVSCKETIEKDETRFYRNVSKDLDKILFQYLCAQCFHEFRQNELNHD
jgi:DNA-directed RNA polymerase subunit RPC12/RpoP